VAAQDATAIGGGAGAGAEGFEEQLLGARLGDIESELGGFHRGTSVSR
jgi:hypothetical protein